MPITDPELNKSYKDRDEHMANMERLTKDKGPNDQYFNQEPDETDTFGRPVPKVVNIYSVENNARRVQVGSGPNMTATASGTYERKGHFSQMNEKEAFAWEQEQEKLKADGKPHGWDQLTEEQRKAGEDAEEHPERPPELTEANKEAVTDASKKTNTVADAKKSANTAS